MKTLKDRYVAKIEGHGRIEFSLKKKKVDLVITEGERHFEHLVIGRHFSEIPFLVSRICGVCPTAHALAAVIAIEDAFGVKVGRRASLLREIMLAGQIVQSHGLHLFYLAVEDHLGIGSAIDLVSARRELYQFASGLKEFADDLLDATSGRSIHPLTPVPGGITREPAQEKLNELRKNIPRLAKTAVDVFEIMANIKYPEIPGENVMLALSAENTASPNRCYTLTSTAIRTSDGRQIDVSQFADRVAEFPAPRSTALSSTLDGRSFMVGALPRTLLNNSGLHAKASRLSRMARWTGLGTKGPYFNLLAQMLEVVHFLEDINHLIRSFGENSASRAKGALRKKVSPRLSAGHGAVEAPRGILYHSYSFDSDGLVTRGNIITPTAQNLQNIKDNFQRFIDASDGLGRARTVDQLEMLLRAYDPCLTCSVH